MQMAGILLPVLVYFTLTTELDALGRLSVTTGQNQTIPNPTYVDWGFTVTDRSVIADISPLGLLGKFSALPYHRLTYF